MQQANGFQVVASARGHRLVIDRPREMGGTDEGMSIGEVFLSSLGACTLLTVAAFCEKSGLAVDQIGVTVEGETVEHPKRLGKIHQTLEIHGNLSESEQETLRRVAERCSVHNTLERTPALTLEMRVLQTS